MKCSRIGGVYTGMILLWIVFPLTCFGIFRHGTLPSQNGGCIDNNNSTWKEGEKRYFQSTCQECICNDGRISCYFINVTCHEPSGQSCKQIPGDGCCPSWDCENATCPDPGSFNRLCIVYEDQCQNDSDCDYFESCCLVSGCGKECMEPCEDSSGIFHGIGVMWKDPNNPLVSYICQDDGIHVVIDDCSLNRPSDDFVDPLADDITGRQSEGVKALSSLRNKWPVRDTNYYLSNFEASVSQTRLGSGGDVTRTFTAFAHTVSPATSASLRAVDVAALRTYIDNYNWTSLVPLLSRNIDNDVRSALETGDRSLKQRSEVNRRIEEMEEKLPQDSPSVKHQESFRRTNPISTNMANLGHIIGMTSAAIAKRFDIPQVATSGLSILGESQECVQRFKSFQRPNLSPSCSLSDRYRTLDGSCNNPANILKGAAFTKLRRNLPPDYGDGISQLRKSTTGGILPSARLVSSKVNNRPNRASKSHTILLMTYGQFIDHDLTATPVGKGYLGGHVKCCDNLGVLLDESLLHLNATKRALQLAKVLEPSLEEENLNADVVDQLLHDIRVTKDAIFNETFDAVSLEDTTFAGGREPHQTSPHLTTLQAASIDSISILPHRPRNQECAPIPIPPSDPFYSKYGQTCMEFVRSAPAAMCTLGPREQLNQHSAYLDGSVIYDVLKGTSNSLRTFQNGRLKALETQEGQRLLPPSHNLFDGCNIPEKYNNEQFCFVAGDGRVNEQPLLTFLQTVWKREHNRIAKILQDYNPDWNDEKVFQETRRIVVAELQHVTYNEFLQVILGPFVMNLLDMNTLTGGSKTTDYDVTLDPSISNVFATAAYRFGHSQISDFILTINKHGLTSAEALSSLFFYPFSLYDQETMGDLARGSTSQPAAVVDSYFTKEVAGNLFKGRHAFGLDLVALNIQRGRDHGIRGYTQWREHCGLEPIKSFEDLSSLMDENVVKALKSVYRSVHDIDLYIGGVSERPFFGGILGPTFTCLVADQFVRIKRGDRYWFEYRHSPGVFTEAQLTQLHKVTLARILCNNIPELSRIQPKPLETVDSSNRIVPCYRIPTYNLRPWRRQAPIRFPDPVFISPQGPSP